LSGSTWPPEGIPAAAGSRPRGETQAGVLVPLFLNELSEPQLVLTRRRADLRRHAGEISFPGGRRDGDDATLLDTALREAEEEIGLPREQASVLGELPATSTFATGYLIHPFVAAIPSGTAWELSPREVDAVLELPLQRVREGRTVAELERRGITFRTDAYVVDDHLIWGATARIIEHLLERLGDGGPPEAPLTLG
jgi:8-oxo-dGTP pyrophosphatase MutT (NUDIX family)